MLVFEVDALCSWTSHTEHNIQKKYLLYCKTASMLGLNELNCFGDGIKDKMTIY